MKIDLSDVLVAVCLLSFIGAAFAWALVAGLVVLGAAAGLLALVFADGVALTLPKVRMPWRS